MIHKVKNYNATLTSPDMGEGGMEVQYRPLIERVILFPRDADEIHRSLILILKAGQRPLVTDLSRPGKRGTYEREALLFRPEERRLSVPRLARREWFVSRPSSRLP
jgi:hypothetical protein